MAKPLISKYQRDRAELPSLKKREILKSIMLQKNLSPRDISTTCRRAPQTVRLWLSSDRREIPIECLQELGNQYGFDIYLEF